MSYDLASDVNTAAVTAAHALELAAVVYLSAAVAAAAADNAMLPVIFADAAIITAKPGVAHAESTTWNNAELAEKAIFVASIEAITAGWCSLGGDECFLGSQSFSEFCIGSIPK